MTKTSQGGTWHAFLRAKATRGNVPSTLLVLMTGNIITAVGILIMRDPTPSTAALNAGFAAAFAVMLAIVVRRFRWRRVLASVSPTFFIMLACVNAVMTRIGYWPYRAPSVLACSAACAAVLGVLAFSIRHARQRSCAERREVAFAAALRAREDARRGAYHRRFDA